MLFGRHLARRHRLAFLDVGHDAVVVGGGGVVQALSIQPQETVEHHHRAGGPQYRRAVLGAHVHRHLVEDGAFHLASHGALPDQLVEAELVLIQARGHIARPAGDIGRTDGFVRLLGVRDLGLIDAGLVRQILRAVEPLDLLTRALDRLGRERRRRRRPIVTVPTTCNLSRIVSGMVLRNKLQQFFPKVCLNFLLSLTRFTC